MTVRTFRQLFCDGPANYGYPVCEHSTMCFESVSPEASLQELRQEALNEGWMRTNNGDFCPACVNQRELWKRKPR